MKRILLILVAATPVLAQEPPAECTTTTTTTVRCTGAAAPYAVQPAPPPPQPIPPPPVAAPQPYYPAPVVLDLHKLERDGWKLKQNEDGTLWRERSVRAGSPGVWGTGIALFSISWIGSGVSSIVDGKVGPAGFIPVLGAWMNAAAVGGETDCSEWGGCTDHSRETALWALGGLVQAAGFVMILAGVASGPKKLERQPVLIAPGAIGDGAGLSAIGRF